MEAIDGYVSGMGNHPNLRAARGVVDVPLMARATFSRSSVRRMRCKEGGGTLLGSISDFCRRTGMAESTFGRRAVNDGKFVARLRDGARVTPETLTRVNDFMAKHGPPDAGDAPPELMALIHAGAPRPARGRCAQKAAGKQFPLLRQPPEVPAVRQHLQREGRGRARASASSSASIHPRPPAVRVFDAGMGDGTVLDARHARDAPALPDGAVLHRRQGDQPRGRAPLAAQDGRPLLRASGHRAGGHQHVLHARRRGCTPRAVPAATSWCGTRSR